MVGCGRLWCRYCVRILRFCIKEIKHYCVVCRVTRGSVRNKGPLGWDKRKGKKEERVFVSFSFILLFFFFAHDHVADVRRNPLAEMG